MATSAFPSQVAFAPESPQGTGPQDGSGWLSDGIRIRHIAESVEFDFDEEPVEDMRSQTRPFAVNRKVKGLRNGERALSVYLTGHGAATDPGQADVFALGTLCGRAFGGYHRGNTTAAATAGTHTSTQVEVDSTANLAVGGAIAWVDPATGLGHPRQIVDIAGDVVSIDPAFPWPDAPSDEDVIAAMSTIYVDSQVVFDSHNGGGSGPHTLSFWWAKGQDGALEPYETYGCMPALGAINLPRGETPTLDFVVHYASWRGPNEGVSTPSWVDDPEGNAPPAIGPDCQIALGDYQLATADMQHPNEVSIDPGVPVVRIPTVTEQQARMQGTGFYSSQPADTLITMTLAEYNSDLWDDWADDTFKAFHYCKVAAPGGMFLISAPRCELAEIPKRAEVESVSGQAIVLRAHESPGSTEMARSKIAIHFG